MFKDRFVIFALISYTLVNTFLGYVEYFLGYNTRNTRITQQIQ